MLIIAFGIALLVIVAGMKLLIHTQKETLGNFYKYVSWFVVVMGFLMLFLIGCSCICRICFRHERMMESRFRMMEEKHQGFYDRKEEAGCCKMMGDHHKKMDRCDGENRCYRSEMNENCSGREDCYEKEYDGEEHHKWKEKCEKEPEVCPMKKEAECKKDSVKKAKHPRSIK